MDEVGRTNLKKPALWGAGLGGVYVVAKEIADRTASAPIAEHIGLVFGGAAAGALAFVAIAWLLARFR